jgi:hypothetical protein
MNDCVEVGLHAGGVAVRDSKARQGNHLRFDSATWTAFLDQLRNGH